MKKLTVKQKKKIKSISQIFGLIAVSIALFIGIKKKMKTEESEESKDHNAKKDVPSSVVYLQTIAKKVYDGLGFGYPAWHPKRWTERDREVFDLVKQMRSQMEFAVMASMYKKHYAKGRDLSSDLAKHLDRKYYNQLTFK